MLNREGTSLFPHALNFPSPDYLKKDTDAYAYLIGRTCDYLSAVG
jgi:hypothetical protein